MCVCACVCVYTHICVYINIQREGKPALAGLFFPPLREKARRDGAFLCRGVVTRKQLGLGEKEAPHRVFWKQLLAGDLCVCATVTVIATDL